MSGATYVIEKKTKFKGIKAVVDYDAMKFKDKDIILIHRYIENTGTGHTQLEDDFEEDHKCTFKQFNKNYRPWLNDTVKEINQKNYLAGKITGCKVGEVLTPDGKCKKMKR